MKVDDENISEQDIESIKIAVQTRQPVDFFCYTLTPDQKIRFQKILNIFLEECDQLYLYNYLSYCLFELLDNASKANAKRIYFRENHLNINDESDYKNGMAAFKEDLSEHTEHYLSELKSGKTIEETAQVLTQEYDVTLEKATSDIEKTIASLKEAGVVEV